MKSLFSLVLILLCCSLAPGISFSEPIHEAAKSGDVTLLRTLLDQDHDQSLLYSKDEQGKTPLHWAVGRGQLEVVKVLLDEYHVKIDVTNGNDGTPLHVAASQAQTKAARMLLDRGAMVNARAKDGATPLHFACFKGRKQGHVEVARMLLQNGADVNAKMDNGATPLSLATSRGNTEILNLIKAHVKSAPGVVDTKKKRR